MNICDDIQNLIDNPEAEVTKDWLDATQEEYPYFPLPLLLYLQRNKDIDETLRAEILSRLALMSPDRVALFDAVGEDASRFVDFYPPAEKPVTPDTNTTIDSFLDRFGKGDAKELEVLNKMIFNPVPDYSSILAAEEESSVPTADEINGAGVSEKDSLINRFIAQSKEQMGHFPTVTETPGPPPFRPKVPDESASPVKEAETPDTSTFSESLAKIYIKQGKYAKALEIIKNISLKFPEKSIYFADQIRFLKKLNLNEQIKNKK